MALTDELTVADEQRALAALAEIAAGEPLAIEPRRGAARLYAEGHALQAHLVFVPGGREAILQFSYRTTSTDVAGDRSDFHDVVPLALAAILSGGGHASMEFVDERGFGNQHEIYGRWLLPQQPGPVVDLDETERLRLLLVRAFTAESVTLRTLHSPENCICQSESQHPPVAADPDWVERAFRALRFRKPPEMFLWQRRWPTWKYLRTVRSRITLVESPSLASLLVTADERGPRVPHLAGEGIYLRSGALAHLVRGRTYDRALDILKRLGDLPAGGASVFPLEDRLVVVGKRHLLALPGEFGRIAFNAGRVVNEQEARRALRFFAGPLYFAWADPVPPARFEALVRDLLRTAGLASRVRHVGTTNDRDRGRDLIADFVLPAGDRVPEGKPTYRLLPVVVQCKAHASLGRADVAAIRDTVDEHSASGYFLAAAGRISAPLVERLQSLRDSAKLALVEWWERQQIEDELRAAPEVLVRYPDVVTGRQVQDSASIST